MIHPDISNIYNPNYILINDFNIPEMEENILLEIQKSTDLTENMKKTQLNFLKILFWIGIKLKDYGYPEELIRKIIPRFSLYIKFSDDRLKLAYKYLKYYCK